MYSRVLNVTDGSKEMRIAKAKLRSRDGFTQNNGNVWGHCEEPEIIAMGTYECPDRTLYKCDLCNQFVCSAHQKRHMKTDHSGAKR